ncbi:hypothetical protein V1657_11665 [Clostridium perfringens]|uniref:hypothetical protein n=1 Tax=Clostridium perfringens TaxID=1502 RepID=UPI002ED489A0|nr:hypothetical protein V1657_11665 [Clostridium perfringens]
MKRREFRPGLKYVFTTKKFKRAAKRDGFYHDSKRSGWFKDCNGLEVNVIDSFNGEVRGYPAEPDWCKVVK